MSLSTKFKKNPILHLLLTEWEHLGENRKKFLFYCGLFVISNLILLLEPLVLGQIFNSIQTSVMNQAGINAIIVKIWALLGITIGFWMFHGVGRVLERRVGFKVKQNYVNSTVKELLELPMKWHKNHHTGDTIDKLNLSSKSLDKFSRHTTFRLIQIIVRIIGSLLILFAFNQKIALIAASITAFSLFIIVRVDRILNKKYTKLTLLSNKVASTIFDYFNNIRTIITLRLKETVKEKVDSRLESTRQEYNGTVVIDELKWAFASFMISLMIVISLTLKSLSDYRLTGAIMIGTLYTLYGYLKTIGNTFYDVAGIYGDIVRRSAHLHNADPIHNAYQKRERLTKVNELTKTWKEIKVNNLNFKYEAEDQISHLKGVNLVLKRGQKIALIGESGSGKSTVLGALRGIYETSGETIFRDGKQLPHGLLHLKEITTLIPQDPEIFNTTLKSNITMELPAKSKDIKKVTKMARLTPIIKKLKNGLNTNVMEKGISLSGGEKQRLALARGLLAGMKSDILLLDEPTSSVDSLNELKIHKNITKEFKDKTIIASVHRLHMLSEFDYIYLLEKGKVIAEGDFKTLKQNKKFSKMWKAYETIK